MARLVCVLITCLVAPGLLWAQGEIVGKTQTKLVINLGSNSGVKVGMTGTIKKPLVLKGRETVYDVGKFRIVSVTATSCEAEITSVVEGWTITTGLNVAIDGIPAIRTMTNPPAGTTSQPGAQVDPNALERDAEAAWNRQEWPRAAELYAQLNRIAPKSIFANRAQQARERADGQKRSSGDADAWGRGEKPRNRALNAAEIKVANRARDQIRAFIEARAFLEACDLTRQLAAFDPNNDFLRTLLAEQKAVAEKGLAESKFEEAMVACRFALCITADKDTSDFCERIQLAIREKIVGSHKESIAELSEELGRVETGKPEASAAAASPALLRRKLDSLRILLREIRNTSDDTTRGVLIDLTKQVIGRGMILMPGGSMPFGCTAGDSECDSDEQPVRSVQVKQFLLDPTEVTGLQYMVFTASTGMPPPSAPGFAQEDDHPVVNVTWDEANAYCRWVGGRLPSEVEWEHAARVGHEGWRFPNGKQIDHEDANFFGKSGRDVWARTSPVASFPATTLGIYDLAGNVWEWCADPYTPDLATDASDRADEYETARLRVLRGGSWLGSATTLRISNRSWFPLASRMFNVGFRCARNVS